MPYKTIAVPAEMFMSYNGINVYHAYKDDDINQQLDYWFVLNENSEFEDAFDIRDLKTWNENKTRQQVLKEAIDSGEIKAS